MENLTDSTKLVQSAIAASEFLHDPRARSTLLAEIAKIQAKTGLLDDALSCVERIDSIPEKRNILLHLALEAVETGLAKTGSMEALSKIVRLMVKSNPSSSHVAGRLALSLLEKNEIAAAVELIGLVDPPFESDRARYDFVSKLLTIGGEKHLNDAVELIQGFSEDDFRDWANLALAENLARWNAWKKAEDFCESFAFPNRQSWAWLQIARISMGKDNTKSGEERDGESGERASRFFGKASEILESVAISGENAESLSIQLRIMGKAFLESGDFESAQRVLERCEAAVASIPVILQRVRAKLFLLKTLVEAGFVATRRDYWIPRETDEPGWDALDRSRIMQWTAEIENGLDALPHWEAAIQSVVPARTDQEEENQIDDYLRAERIAEVVRRFASQVDRPEPTGDPDRDALILSGEEFESYYFSPFAIRDCGC